MFVRRLRIERVTPHGVAYACPLAWIDKFATRNHPGDGVFSDTLPVEDGLLEAGFRVPLEELQAAMEEWFRRKGYLVQGEKLRITELTP